MYRTLSCIKCTQSPTIEHQKKPRVFGLVAREKTKSAGAPYTRVSYTRQGTVVIWVSAFRFPNSNSDRRITCTFLESLYRGNGMQAKRK